MSMLYFWVRVFLPVQESPRSSLSQVPAVYLVCLRLWLRAETATYSHWYINSAQQQPFDPAKDAYDKAVNILRKDLTAAECQVIQRQNSIQDVRFALDKALEEYQKKSKASKVRDWLAKCSSRVMYYGGRLKPLYTEFFRNEAHYETAVFDTFSQHHPEYVSLAWGAFKFIFIAVFNYEELLVEVSKAVSRIADVLPRTEFHSLLYSTPRMQENVTQLYAKTLDFSIKAIQFYKKGKLSHSIASIVKPFSLTFKPIIEEIRERSIRVDELASALSKAEIRDLHVKVHRLSQSVAQLTEMMVFEEDSLAEALSALAEQHLDLDVLDQSRDTSNFISYLLDTIQILEAEVNYNDAYSEINVTEEEYEEAVSMFDRGVVNARHLQKLFQPNKLVILKTSDDFNVYALDDSPEILKEEVLFVGWSYVYSETSLRQKIWRDKMSPVGDKDVKISSLKVHPVSFGGKEDIENLTLRGQAFWGMKGQHYGCYTGWDHRHEHCYNSSRFMVDLATHQLMHPSKKVGRHVAIEEPINQVWPKQIKWEDKITPETILLLPSTVHGFNLQEKKWVDLDVDKFHPVTWNKNAFKRLVLEEKTKEMIYALVDIQTATKRMDDIITGKGNGLIVLLHGSPGTGKTLTAESVAEIAEKPLYRVTCGDIGTEAQDVEKYLATVLYLGKLWDCVLLLDEADVFLEERTFADLQRNSLVSVFLRALEYSEGILILTSNRVGHFDEAFKSRIQVAIHYDNLSKRSRKDIWQNFLEMIEDSADEDANIAELEDHLDQLASEEMNGRQIRNALLTARLLAKQRKERLEWVHLDQVMKTSAAFNKYLKTPLNDCHHIHEFLNREIRSQLLKLNPLTIPITRSARPSTNIANKLNISNRIPKHHYLRRIDDRISQPSLTHLRHQHIRKTPNIRLPRRPRRLITHNQFIERIPIKAIIPQRRVDGLHAIVAHDIDGDPTPS
ncbi:ATPase family AAA domain-containing protein 3B [Colletotrichum aenigma]|uniref:ATPase family AAA domain-containing protein 3B n=1 Tax=Colletotrichum aenigma TaxID=1215731 RepID=UPI0018731180|nr:ATPase family AAA domain-containing protein 3B [Colletotrichum aenigma]KAF5502570.1 ATPase family AAA domain-containing protein 3B [Colletotrichum aenigma]